MGPNMKLQPTVHWPKEMPHSDASKRQATLKACIHIPSRMDHALQLTGTTAFSAPIALTILCRAPYECTKVQDSTAKGLKTFAHRGTLLALVRTLT